MSWMIYMKPWQWLFVVGSALLIVLLLVRSCLEAEIKRKERKLSRISSSKEATLCWVKLQDARYAFDVVENVMTYIMIPVFLMSIYIVFSA